MNYNKYIHKYYIVINIAYVLELRFAYFIV